MGFFKNSFENPSRPTERDWTRDRSNADVYYSFLHSFLPNSCTSLPLSGGRRPSVSQGPEFWRLDVWEDDLRRRRRLIKNPYGTTHPDATLRQPTADGDLKDPNGFGKAEYHRCVILPPPPYFYIVAAIFLNCRRHLS